MDNFLAGKTALVTGGTRGIGRAVAESLVRAGAAVVICGRDEGAAKRAAGELSAQTKGRVVGAAADVSRFEDVSQLFRSVDAELGGLDILVNNAGLGIMKKTADLTPKTGVRRSTLT